MQRISMRVAVAMGSLALVVLCGRARAETSVQFGVAASGLQFDFLYRDYGIDPVRAQPAIARVGESDYVVALYLSNLSGVGIEVIVQWRQAGVSWDTITQRCHLDSQAYYVELPPDVTPRPPYGRACGYWRRNPRGNIALQDDEIRELVIVKALSRHCGVAPGTILRARATGRSAKEIAAQHGRAKPREDTSPRSLPSNAGREKHSGKKHGKSS